MLTIWINEAEAAGEPIGERLRLGSIYALALGANFGGYSLAFSASLAGLLWKNILKNNPINPMHISLRTFAKQNLPCLATSIAVAGIALLIELIIVARP